MTPMQPTKTPEVETWMEEFERGFGFIGDENSQPTPKCKEFLKDFIAQVEREAKAEGRRELKEELLGKIEKLKSKCSCGCEFKDGCLCKDKRKGFEKAKKEITDLISNI